MENQIITVTGKGSIRVASDVIWIDILLTGKFMTYSEAYFHGKAECRIIADVVTKHGLDSSIVSTLNLDIDKQTVMEYDKYSNSSEEVLVGYVLKHSLRIMLPKEYGHLDAIIGDIGRVFESVDVKVGYTVRDSRQAQLKVLAKAVEESRLKAEVMAEAAGYKLGGVSSIEYSEPESGSAPVCSLFDTNSNAGQKSSEIQKSSADDIVFTDKVTVSWFLKG